MNIANRMLMLLMLAGSALLAGCEEAEEVAEETGEVVEEGLEEAVDAAKKTGDKIDDAI